MKHGLSSGNLSSSRALSDSCCWISIIRELHNTTPIRHKNFQYVSGKLNKANIILILRNRCLQTYFEVYFLDSSSL